MAGFTVYKTAGLRINSGISLIGTSREHHKKVPIIKGFQLLKRLNTY